MQASVVQMQPLFKQKTILGALIRSEFKRKNLKILDLSYLKLEIERIWHSNSLNRVFEIGQYIKNELRAEHLELIQSIDRVESDLSGLILEKIFVTEDKQLAATVHDCFTELARIVDIKYPYEDHRELSPSIENGKEYTEWGRGLGAISMHSDDLYEKREINMMCLTICRDLSSTPTKLIQIKDLLALISDADIELLYGSEARFISGKNVNGEPKVKCVPIFSYSHQYGLSAKFDFRIDRETGKRMVLLEPKANKVLEKLRRQIQEVPCTLVPPRTGTVAIISNSKILHGREELSEDLLYEGTDSRILLRSKGIKVS